MILQMLMTWFSWTSATNKCSCSPLQVGERTPHNHHQPHHRLHHQHHHLHHCHHHHQHVWKAGMNKCCLSSTGAPRPSAHSRNSCWLATPPFPGWNLWLHLKCKRNAIRTKLICPLPPPCIETNNNLLVLAQNWNLTRKKLKGLHCTGVSSCNPIF